jgi:hypothetical protein
VEVRSNPLHDTQISRRSSLPACNPTEHSAGFHHLPIMTDAKINLLFVCSRNQWRSPTAEKLYSCAEHPGRLSVQRSVPGTLVASIEMEFLKWAACLFVAACKRCCPNTVATKLSIVREISVCPLLPGTGPSDALHKRGQTLFSATMLINFRSR